MATNGYGGTAAGCMDRLFTFLSTRFYETRDFAVKRAIQPINTHIWVEGKRLKRKVWDEMAYTTIKITEKSTLVRSECPKCGVTSRKVFRKKLEDLGEIKVACIACRNVYRAGVFSTRWDGLRAVVE